MRLDLERRPWEPDQETPVPPGPGEWGPEEPGPREKTPAPGPGEETL